MKYDKEWKLGITANGLLSGNIEIAAKTNLCSSDDDPHVVTILTQVCWGPLVVATFNWFQSLSGTSNSSPQSVLNCVCVYLCVCVLLTGCDNTDWLTDADEDNKRCRWRGVLADQLATARTSPSSQYRRIQTHTRDVLTLILVSAQYR